MSVSAAIPSKILGEEFELLYEDRYFYIDNYGLTRVIVYLNGYQFKLTVDPQEVRQGANTYLIPLRGIVNINIFPLVNPQRNLMRIDGSESNRRDCYHGKPHHRSDVAPLNKLSCQQ